MYFIRRSFEKGTRYPDQELLNDYQGLSFADLASTPAIQSMTQDVNIELGDSGYWYRIIYDPTLTDTIGKKKIIEYFHNFAKEIKTAIPQMSEKYQKFYVYFLDDIEKNGIIKYLP